MYEPRVRGVLRDNVAVSGGCTDDVRAIRSMSPNILKRCRLPASPTVTPKTTLLLFVESSHSRAASPGLVSLSDGEVHLQEFCYTPPLTTTPRKILHYIPSSRGILPNSPNEVTHLRFLM